MGLGFRVPGFFKSSNELGPALAKLHPLRAVCRRLKADCELPSDVRSIRFQGLGLQGFRVLGFRGSSDSRVSGFRRVPKMFVFSSHFVYG